MPQVARFLALAGLAVVGLTSCGQAPTLPVYGYEIDEFACQDGEDNDFDGLIDCHEGFNRLRQLHRVQIVEPVAVVAEQ
ncbi:MAG: hypothetical protein KUG77_24485, partial [Nannocystaceae bacterium]|nr:hypothetical protein [Nannocystaceae bacterium]